MLLNSHTCTLPYTNNNANIRCIAIVTRQVQHMEQELLTFPEYLSSF